MAEITVDTGVLSEPNNEPTVVFNGEIIPISQLQQKADTMQSSINSGYQKKLADERAQLEKERQEIADKLNRDKQWINEHYNDPEAMANYKPLVEGGEGYVGKKTTQTPNNSSVFQEESQVIRELKNELAAIKQQVNTVISETDEQGKQRVMKTRDILKGKYPYADVDAVNDRMENWWRAQGGKHPTDTQIEEWLKKSDEHVRKESIRIEKAKQTAPIIEPTKATPSAGGQTAGTPTQPKVGLDNPTEFFDKRIRPKLQTTSFR